MTFVNFSLLAGTLLVALPIVLHLIMRRRPTLLEFPALRFIQRQHDANQRRLQLRHLLLLLLRAAAIALLALALARPSVKLSSVSGGQESPVAAALVFDTAPHMEYRHQNQTRLEAGRDLGLWLLAQLPRQSEVAVLDTRLGAAAAFAADRGAAQQHITRLETAANSQPIPAAIEAAARLLRKSSLPRRELYVFTDLSRGAWPEDQAARLQQQLGSLDGLGVYLIDVGVSDPIDYGLAELRLSGDVLSNHGKLAIETGLSCIGAPATRVVELHVQGPDGQPQKRSEQSCTATPGELQEVEFHVGGFEPGVHQGFLRIVGQDGLAADDQRYFTVEVKPAWRVLIAAPPPAEAYALFVTEALAPAMFRKRGEARFDCHICDLSELASRQLTDYAAVFLLDPTPLDPAIWRRLAEFAAEGRGVAIFLGRNASPIDSFNASEAQELLPGKLLRQARRTEDEVRLAPRDYQHPILAPFRQRAGDVPWELFPVFRYWQLDQPPAGVSMVLPYSDEGPAILERSVGRGCVLTMTTPISDRPSRNPWNMLMAGENWPPMIVVNQMADYLVGGSDQRFNYTAGQAAVLKLDDPQRGNYMLFAPGQPGYPVSADLKRREIAVTTTEQVGNYRVKAGGSAGVDLGFSVNYAADQTRLDRLDDQEIANVLGPIKFRLARTRDQIDRDISMGRMGHDCSHR